MQVIVHFNSGPNGSGGRDLRAIAGPGVKAIFLDRAARDAFIELRNAAGSPLNVETGKIPAPVTLKSEKGDTDAAPLSGGEAGPDVCYLVDDTMVCWNG